MLSSGYLNIVGMEKYWCNSLNVIYLFPYTSLRHMESICLSFGWYQSAPYRVKVGNIAHMVWFAHFLFTDSAYIAHAFQCITISFYLTKCQCYEYPWCYKSPEDDNPIYRLVGRTTAFPGGRNSLLSAWSLVFVIETIVISVQNICRSMLIRESICTYHFELWS